MVTMVLRNSPPLKLPKRADASFNYLLNDLNGFPPLLAEELNWTSQGPSPTFLLEVM